MGWWDSAGIVVGASRAGVSDLRANIDKISSACAGPASADRPNAREAKETHEVKEKKFIGNACPV